MMKNVLPFSFSLLPFSSALFTDCALKLVRPESPEIALKYDK